MQVIENFAQGVFCGVPHLVVVVVFLLVRRVAQRQHAAVVGDAEILVSIEDQVHDLGELVLDLIRSDEQVCVVLAEMAASFDALERAGSLVAEVVRDLAYADRQVPVRMRLVCVYAHVVRAVHGP